MNDRDDTPKFTLDEVISGQVEVLSTDAHDERADSMRAALGRLSADRETRMLDPERPVLPQARGDVSTGPFTFQDRARRAAARFDDAATNAPDTWLDFDSDGD